MIVTEPSPALHADTTAMAFDIGAGIYWRPEEGGFLWGMSNPAEEPGPGHDDRLDLPAEDAATARTHCSLRRRASA